MSKQLFKASDLLCPIERLELESTMFIAPKFKRREYSGKAAAFVKELEQIILTEPDHIDFMTAGNLSLHAIIEVMLHKIGPCLQMYISTWAIKEAAARSLFALKKAGMIGSLYGVFDYRIKTLDSRAFQLVEHLFAKVELTKNHSKVILIEYKNTYITILSSANLSNNPRIETGFISFNKNVFMFHKEWMEKVFQGKKVY